MSKELTKKELDALKAAHVAFYNETGVKIVSASKIKAYFKALGFRSSSDLSDAVANEVYKAMWKALQRAISNDRSTVRPNDL